MVDKFMGAGVMALFGVPIARPDHPRRALGAALELLRAAAGISHPRLPRPLELGCGVNCGEMVVGNVGSERRLDYTAIGNTVNLSKRLEELAGPGQILVAEPSYRRLGAVRAEPLGGRQVKGLADRVLVYNVTALA